MVTDGWNEACSNGNKSLVSKQPSNFWTKAQKGQGKDTFVDSKWLDAGHQKGIGFNIVEVTLHFCVKLGF